MLDTKIKSIILVLFTLTVFGCRNKLPPGHYEGNLFWKAISEYGDTPVSIEVAYEPHRNKLSPKIGHVTISDQNGNAISSINLNLTLNNFYLEIPAVYPQAFSLKKVKNGIENSITCYENHDYWSAELCFDDMRFSLRIFDQNRVGVFKLSSNAFGKNPEFTLEPPTQLHLDDAIRRALNANLDSRIAFEHVIQAKYVVTAAYLNLIPHLTTNLIWNADPGYISAIATLQGLAPFLLPTYWLQAKESQYDAKIKRDAETILKSDLAAMVEQLSYAYDRDQQIYWIQEDAIESLDRFANRVVDLEKTGRITYGSSYPFKTLIEKVRGDKEKTQQLVQEDQYVMSQALGFHNPEAVTQVLVPSFNPVGKYEPLSRQEIAGIASQRSFELRQMSFLKKIAHLKKVELFFAWVDPTGDPKSSFGFNTIPQLKLAKSQERELEIKREQLQQTIYQNCYRIVDQYNSTVDFVGTWHSNSESLNQSLDSLLDRSLEGVFQSDRVIRLVEEHLSNKIGLLANVTAHRIARSKIDRVLLAGYYEYLWPMLDQVDSENALP